MKKYNFCNNCGRQGHLYHQCKNPIISSGIIAFKKFENEFKFLLICRKDSLGYVDFMRGKYPLTNKVYIQNLIDEMTIYEKDKILNEPFNKLWKELWNGRIALQYRSEENISSNKLKKLKNGVILKKNDTYNLKVLLENSKTRWEVPEWGFPKGRRNYQENDINCAVREFEEETGYTKNDIQIIHNIIPFEEIFTGSNYKSYKHKYFIAYMLNSSYTNNQHQKSEVSKMEWLTYEESLNKIRPYNLEKKNIIERINRAINSGRLIL